MSEKRSCKANHVDTFNEVKKAGDIHTYQGATESGLYMAFMCPCGDCESVDAVSLPPERNPGWSWNGSRESATLKPSLHRMTGCKWHGYLTDRQFVEC